MTGGQMGVAAGLTGAVLGVIGAVLGICSSRISPRKFRYWVISTAVAGFVSSCIFSWLSATHFGFRKIHLLAPVGLGIFLFWLVLCWGRGSKRVSGD